MARVRMIVLALAACGACGRAEAVPAPAVQPPAGWQPLADVATAASEAAKAEGVTVTSAAAWGETAMGCYAIALSVRGGGATPKDVIAGLGAIAVHDVSEGSGSLALAFEKGEYRGKLHATLADDSIEAIACYWNQREPAACAAACDGMWK